MPGHELPVPASAPMAETFDVIVVGGGVTGCSAAWQLARLGAGRVLLLERAELASGGTGRSTAVIRTHYAHPVLAGMALDARRFFESFESRIGGHCGFRRTGFLVLSAAADRDAVAANVEMHRGLGIDARVLAPGQLHEVDPRLDPIEVGIAAWEPDSGHADPHGTTAAFAAAARREGATIRTHHPVLALAAKGDRVTGVSTAGGSIDAGQVVLAAGFSSRLLLAPLGVDLPLVPVRHPIAVLKRPPAFGRPHPVISDRVFGSYYMPEGAELSVLGTTAPFDGEVDESVHTDRSPGAEDVERMAGRFLRRFPGQESAQLQSGWTGVYDCSPDLQPILGPVPGWRGLQVAAGFSGHGFKLSPVVGEMLAAAAIGKQDQRHDIGLFSLSRFDEHRPIVAAHAYSVPTLG